jgi:hypothetical protein
MIIVVNLEEGNRIVKDIEMLYMPLAGRGRGRGGGREWLYAIGYNYNPFV